jgi:ribosome-binding protein aMBF1 (putative translation factor)
MSHQDFKPVVLKKTKLTNHTYNSEGSSVFRKLDSDEPDAPKTIQYSQSLKIQKGRNLKKMSQKDLAMKINVPVNTINSYESGTVIPNKSVLRKIQDILEIKL